MSRYLSWLAMSLVLYLVIFSLNYNVLGYLSSHDEKRLLELLLISLALLWLIMTSLEAKDCLPIWKTRYHLTLTLVIILAIISALLSASPSHALLEISVFVGLFYLSLFMAALWRQYSLLLVHIWVYALFLGALFYMVAFYTGYIASFITAMPLHWPEPFFGFSNVRFFNQYQLWTLALLCLPSLSFTVRHPLVRRSLSVIFSAWWLLLFASASRGVLLAWLCAVILTGIGYRQLAWPLLKRQFMGFSVGLLAYCLLFKALPLLLKGGLITSTVFRNSTYDRLDLWQQALTMIQNHPWFGVGPMHYAYYPNTIAAHPHNSILQLAAEWGLLATGLLLLVATQGLFCWLQRFTIKTLQTSEHQHLVIVLFFTLIACASYSLVDGVLVMPLSQVMMALVIGLMIGLYYDQSDKNLCKPHISQQVFAAITLITMLWSAWPELLPRLLDNQTQIPRGYQTIGPRFWQEGGIRHEFTITRTP